MVFMIGTPFSWAASNWLLTNLDGAWKYDSDATDETGNSDWTATSITRDTTHYKAWGASAEGDGSLSYIDLNTTPDINNFSFSLWFRSHTYTTVWDWAGWFITTILTPWTDRKWFVFNLYDWDIRPFVYEASGVNIMTYTAFSINTWYNLVCTYDSSASSWTFKYYIDGTLKDTLTNCTITWFNGLMTHRYYTNNTTNKFDGEIDEVYMRSKTLVQDDVDNLQTLFYPDFS